jgi:hypothetical protein
VRQRFVAEGFEAAVLRKAATNRQDRKLDGDRADDRSQNTLHGGHELGVLLDHPLLL